MNNECCRNCKEWVGLNFNLLFARCNTLEKDTSSTDWCHEYISK